MHMWSERVKFHFDKTVLVPLLIQGSGRTYEDFSMFPKNRKVQRLFNESENLQ